jgi:glycosyltransferase involved in cell wall biosynthesis
MDLSKAKVMIGVVTPGPIENASIQSIMRLPPIGQMNVRFEDSRPLDRARNEVIEIFLDSDIQYDYLLFVDSDVVLPRNTWKLIENDLDIVSGLYHVWMHGDVFPVIFKKSRPGYWKSYLTWEENKIVPTDAVAGGCLLIKREVLEKIDYPWFVMSYVMKDVNAWNWGEDFYFSDKAIEHGYKLWVDTSVVCNHFAKVPLLDIINIMRRTPIEPTHEKFEIQ